MLKGKGRTTYLSLSIEQSSDYEAIRAAVCKAYKLTTEHYRSNFHNFRKEQSSTYVEYAHSLIKNFDRWVKSAQVDTFVKLKELVVLEQFLRGIPLAIKTYIMEREVTSLERAASLAEDYCLIHNFSNHKSKVQHTVASKSQETPS